jgi:tetratricopeptide (TPR) repeat protein
LNQFNSALKDCQSAIDLELEHPTAWEIMGDLKVAMKDRRGGIEANREFLRLGGSTEPNDLRARVLKKIGDNFWELSDAGEALLAYEQAARLVPKDAVTLKEFGSLLEDMGAMERACQAYEAASTLSPQWPAALCGYGRVLTKLGKLDDALPFLRRGHELGSWDPDWKRRSANWVTDCERLMRARENLPKVLAGSYIPASAAECIAFAQICALRRDWIEAVRLFEVGLKKQSFAERQNVGHKEDAAKAALRALEGAPGRGLPDKERTRLTTIALAWMNEELALCLRGRTLSEMAGGSGPFISPAAVRATMDRWLADPAFAPVRDGVVETSLKSHELKGWSDFWVRVRTAAAEKTSVRGASR